jgi:hypothetical protein
MVIILDDPWRGCVVGERTKSWDVCHKQAVSGVLIMRFLVHVRKQHDCESSPTSPQAGGISAFGGHKYIDEYIEPPSGA